MQMDLVSFSLAFVEGFGLILSPCILPILPIVLSAALDGNKNRPYGIVLGFIICFSLFTFSSRALVNAIGLDLNLVRYFSFGLLILFALLMISDYLSRKFENLTQSFANLGGKLSTNTQETGFVSGFWFGCLVGLIWTPCAGPILAIVIVQSVLQTSGLSGFLTILFFSLGVAIPMLLIILFGRGLIQDTSWLSRHSIAIRKLLGCIIIMTVLAIYFAPNIFVSTKESSAIKAGYKNEIVGGLMRPYHAADLKEIELWVNSKPLEIVKLRGKVVLVDFWAYSCINCIRTLPYLKNWYKKYHGKGFEIIGVHSPEFDFERVPDNVKRAVQQYSINYPVALDNNFATWKNYNNHYWPAHYLIDKNGMVVYEHFGEGKYNITENNIRYLLGIKATNETNVETENKDHYQSPETYLGYARMSLFLSPELVAKDTAANYSAPKNMPENYWALQGKWGIGKEKISSAEKNARIKMHYHAKQVYAVMGSGNAKPIKVKIYNDGVEVKTIMVSGHRLYNVISLSEPSSSILELTAVEPGLEIYTFTFGG